jgi:hypothetical protein
MCTHTHAHHDTTCQDHDCRGGARTRCDPGFESALPCPIDWGVERGVPHPRGLSQSAPQADHQACNGQALGRAREQAHMVPMRADTIKLT